MMLFFGPPGSGKSVQGQLLVARNHWSWLSTGELFRKAEDPAILARLATGELIDDEMTNQVLFEELKKHPDLSKVVLDGYPRNALQAEWFIEHLPRHGEEIKTVIVFETPREELIRRLSGRGRDEDKLEVIERRLNIYEKRTQPVLDLLLKRGHTICKINGQGSVGVVHDRIQAAVEAS